MDEIIHICDKVTVLRDGKVAGTLEEDEINKNTLSKMIVGKSETENEIDKENEGLISNDISLSNRKKILAVNNFSLRGSFYNISFHLYQNEILGIAGLVGSGRTEILRAMAGIMPPEEGDMTMDGGKHLRFNNSWDAIKNGIVYLTENRDEDGIINNHSVKNNLSLSYLVSVLKGIIIGKEEEKELAGQLVKALHISTSSLDEEVQNLSGGNRQKVLLGRISSTRSKVLLLDEPTKGIDISAKRSILETIRNKLSKDTGVIFTSPGIDDMIEVCDRILILVEGRICGEFIRKEFDELEIYRAIQGI